jgi:hypothetical protein
MKRTTGIICLLLLVSWHHPVHVSVTNIDLDPARGMVDLSVKIFADDFQDLILHNYAVQLRITEQESPEEQIETVNRYIWESLKLEINGKDTARMRFKETSLNEEAIWLQYRYEHGSRIRKLKVMNTLMLETFDDQTNLVIISYDKKQNGYRMNNKNTELTLNIK